MEMHPRNIGRNQKLDLAAFRQQHERGRDTTENQRDAEGKYMPNKSTKFYNIARVMTYQAEGRCKVDEEGRSRL